MLVQTLTDKENSEESTQLLDKPKEVLLARITRFLKHPDIKHDHIATLQDAVTPSKMPYLDNIDARLETLTHMRHHLDTQIRKSPLKYGGIDLRLVSKLTWALNMIAPMEVIREAHDAVEDGIDDEEVDIGWVVNWGVCGNDILLEAIRMFFPNPDNHSFDQLFVCCDTDRSQIDALPMSDIDQAQLACLLRDKDTCVITKSADPQICLVLQFPDEVDEAWLKPMYQYMQALLMFDVPYFTGGSFSLANLISLNDTLSKWWAKAWIALEPISQSDVSIRLRLRWLRMPMFDEEKGHTAGKAHEGEGGAMCPRTVFLDADPRLISEERRTQSGKPLRMVHFETCEYIEDGYEFDITAEKKEDLPDFGSLLFRYRLSLLISLSGEGLY